MWHGSSRDGERLTPKKNFVCCLLWNFYYLYWTHTYFTSLDLWNSLFCINCFSNLLWAKCEWILYICCFQPASIASATNIDTLLAGQNDKEDVVVPSESIQDKVFFIFNNLSLANMTQKVGRSEVPLCNHWVKDKTSKLYIVYVNGKILCYWHYGIYLDDINTTWNYL